MFTVTPSRARTIPLPVAVQAEIDSKVRVYSYDLYEMASYERALYPGYNFALKNSVENYRLTLEDQARKAQLKTAQTQSSSYAPELRGCHI